VTKQHFDQAALRDYYGAILRGSADLKTGACCCTDEGLSPRIKDALAEIEDEVLGRFYGCGSPLPPLLEGCRVLDLGCGSGRDAFLASRLVGPRTIPEWPHWLDLDDHHRLHTSKPMLVCGNTAAMLQDTRYGSHFEVRGDRSVHYGPFDCGTVSKRPPWMPGAVGPAVEDGGTGRGSVWRARAAPGTLVPHREPDRRRAGQG
jgi:hypothetical protein